MFQALGGVTPTKEQVERFVNDNFLPPGSEFDDWEPMDWKTQVALFDTIKVSPF